MQYRLVSRVFKPFCADGAGLADALAVFVQTDGPESTSIRSAAHSLAIAGCGGYALSGGVAGPGWRNCIQQIRP
jgi:hypothetical protein